MKLSKWSAAAVTAWLACVPVGAQASEWWLVAATQDSYFLMDRESIESQRVLSRIVRAAWEQTFKKGASGKFFVWKRTLILYDCASKSFAYRALIEYDENDQTASNTSAPDSLLRFDYIPPDTIGESKIRFVCNAEKGDGESIQFRIGDDEFNFVSDPTKLAEAMSNITAPSSSKDAKPSPGARRASPAQPPAPARVLSTGTAFFIDGKGDVLTAAHVVSSCQNITSDRYGTLTKISVDEVSDLALLSTHNSGNAYPTLRDRGMRLGEPVSAVGFPLSDVLGATIRLTTGSVSGLSGLRGDRSSFQISAPIQPGNSGGPVLDADGRLAGLVTSKLDEVKFAQAGGGIPQNVNFAVTSAVLASFLQENGVTLPDGNGSADPAKFTFQVKCTQ